METLVTILTVIWNVLDFVFSFVMMIAVPCLFCGVPVFILQAILSTDDTKRKNWPF